MRNRATQQSSRPTCSVVGASTLCNECAEESTSNVRDATAASGKEAWIEMRPSYRDLRIFTIDKHPMLRHYGCVNWSSSLSQGTEGRNWRENMSEFFRRIWSEDEGQDIAEYAVMLAVILVLVVGTIRLIGSNANNVFSNTASSIQ
jgi:Flp pilus assembly pilin Flp